MGFNTRPSTIREISSFVNKRQTNVDYQLQNTDPYSAEYQYLLNRKNFLQKHVDTLESLIGKKIPKSKRRKKV